MGKGHNRKNPAGPLSTACIEPTGLEKYHKNRLFGGINPIFNHGVYFSRIEAYFAEFALLFLMKNLSQ